jgi:hypothetical protein
MRAVGCIGSGAFAFDDPNNDPGTLRRATSLMDS